MRVLDTAAVSAWATGCVHSLASLRPAIDEINVYPVADSDTGSNMLFTMAGAARELEEAEPENAADALKILARGAVASAKGNSGVILSQVVRGLADSARGRARRRVAGQGARPRRRGRDRCREPPGRRDHPDRAARRRARRAR